MKNPEHVAELLAELRALAENDFERHRIDVLEQDLHEPPKVEQVDEKYQRFNGIFYRRQTNGRYSTTKQIHRDVWQYYFGEISEGYEIHHADENPANNNVENLQCMLPEEHHHLHLPKGQQIPRQKEEFTCKQCGKKYSTFKRKDTAFCSRECHDKYRYQHDREIRICKFCGEEYSVFRYNKNQFCSRECRCKFTVQQNLETRTCPYCGKMFEARKTLQKKYCSKTCAVNANRGARKKD